jgi:Carbohydrate-binding module 48 (Isoamylase N-terminal domain)
MTDGRALERVARDRPKRPQSTGWTTGMPYPLGATVRDGGVQFSVYSKHATVLDLVLFDDVDSATPSDAIRLDPRVNRTGDYWQTNGLLRPESDPEHAPMLTMFVGGGTTQLQVATDLGKAIVEAGTPWGRPMAAPPPLPDRGSLPATLHCAGSESSGRGSRERRLGRRTFVTLRP